MDDRELTDNGAASLRLALSQALPYLGIILCLAVAAWLAWSRLL